MLLSGQSRFMCTAIPIPEINLLINAFAEGVKAVNPEAKHLVAWIGTFFDPPKAREAGLAMIDAGADILLANGSARRMARRSGA